MEQEQPKKGWRDFIRMIRGTKPPVLLMCIALVMSIGATLVGISIPLLTKNVVNQFSLESLDKMKLAWLGAAFVFQAAAGGVSVYLLSLAGNQIVASLRDKLWQKLLHLPVPFYDKHETGDMISRTVNDTGIVKNLVTEHLSSFITGIISIVGSIAVLLYLDWRMTLLMLLAVPLSMLVLMPLGRKMYHISKGMQEETARFTSVLSRVLSEIRLVKASNAERTEYEQGKDGIMNLLKLGMRESKVQAFVSPLIYFVLMLLFVTIIGYGGMRVSSGELTSGDLVAFILYLFQIVMPITQITQFFTQSQKAIGATERIIRTFEVAEENIGAGVPAVHDPRQAIELERVSFGYAEQEPVLKDVSILVKPGKVTAIVGPSGSGKTTLFSLLERFYTPQSGSIRVGGKSIDEYSLQTWRSQIGYVSQESPLVAGTIRENIIYGLEREVSEAELEAAATMAYADTFIRELPRQYETEVGERGIKLSGGQRQRIAIARALLRNPQILMLDEATSSLDSRSEAVVQQALANLMRGRTTLVIAHRLSTVVDADQIVVIEKGKVTGTGTHHELYQHHGMYKQFADQQLRMQPVS